MARLATLHSVRIEAPVGLSNEFQSTVERVLGEAAIEFLTELHNNFERPAERNY